MKITVITGSPRKNGCSNILVNEFTKGAMETGNEVFVFNAATSRVNNCVACNHCAMGHNHCVFNDDFMQLKDQLLSSDILVFATPLYYFGFSSQIKKIIDRFYCINYQLQQSKMKTMLISSQHSPNVKDTKELIDHYNRIVSWLNMESIGMLNAIGIEDGIDLKDTPYVDQANSLGKNLGS